jgi:glycosyltransferase involved in cell wall biosynthesis
MKIAVVHPYPVHAAAVGGVTRVYELARFLAARRHEVTILTHEADGHAGADQALAALGVRQLAFPLPTATRVKKLSWWLTPEPYFVSRNVNPALTEALTALDRAAPFDVVHLELAYMFPCLSGVGPRATRVLAEQEVMSQAMARLRRIPWRDRTLYEKVAPLAAAKVRRFEHNALRQFDLLYGITPTERDELQKAAGRPVAVFPHVVVANRFAADPARPRCGSQVLFIGNFGHRPNLHAATWFVEQVWPLVRAEHPDARFTVVGPGLSQAAQARLAAPGVELTGYAPDIQALYQQAGVVVTPLHSGGGMRGKVLEAFAAGCAVVGTAMSFEGIRGVSGVHCETADEPRSFADAVIRYASTPALRTAHGAAARQLVRDYYDAARVFARYEAELQRAVDERQSHHDHRTIA